VSFSFREGFIIARITHELTIPARRSAAKVRGKLSKLSTYDTTHVQYILHSIYST